MPDNETQLTKAGSPGNEPAHALVRAEGAETPEDALLDERFQRFERLPMQLDVMVRAASLRVKDLLALERGTVVEALHEHSQDVPVRCGGAVLAWGEFEMVEQKLAVRITRLG